LIDHIKAEQPTGGKRFRFVDGIVRYVSKDVMLLCEEWTRHEYHTINFQELLMSYNFYDGGDFVDVGAYHGLYPWCLAPRAGKAKFLMVEALHKYIRYVNRVCGCLAYLFPDIEFHTIAKPASDTNMVAAYGGPKSFRSFRPGLREAKVEAVRIDDLVEELKMEPTFIKVDTEGAEPFVLRGAKQTLRKFKPKLMVELHHDCHTDEPTSIQEVLDLLNNLGYIKVYSLDVGLHRTERTYWINKNE